MKARPGLGDIVLNKFAALPNAWLSITIVVLLLANVPARAADNAVENGAFVAGTVTDETGSLVTGATVSAGGREKAGSATTDGNGHFRLAIDDMGRGRIVATLFVQARDGRLGLLHVRQEKPEPVRVVVKPVRALEVSVLDGDGKPVADADVVFLASTSPIVKGRTNDGGRWRGRIPFEASEWSVFARKSNVGFDYASGEHPPGSLEKPKPLPEQLTLTLDGARTLRVMAVDRDGKPIAGVRVGPWMFHKPDHETQINLGGTFLSWPATGQDGIVALDWLPDRFVHTLSVMTWSDDYYAIEPASYIRADQPQNVLPITLLPQERLSGRVTFADGRPAPGVVVSIEGHGAGNNRFVGSPRTDNAGRFRLKVYSEQAYIIAVARDQWAAPFRAGIIVRAGKPLDGIDFVLGRATRLHGRVTVGKEARAVPNAPVAIVIAKGVLPEEFQEKGKRSDPALSMTIALRTDTDGAYSVPLGPGEYEVRGPAQTEPLKVTIPVANQPAELVRNFPMLRPEAGLLAGAVVDDRGRAVGGAIVNGRYASTQSQRWFYELKSDDQGQFSVERSLDPLVLHAKSADGSLAGVARLDAQAAKARIVVGPVTTLSGRLRDLEGKALGGKTLEYGIRVYLGDPATSPYGDEFGGTAETDAEGRFRLAGLIPGETYQVSVRIDKTSSRKVAEITPKAPGPFEVGNVDVDLGPVRAYVPPTPEQRAAEAFAASGSTPPSERKAFTLAEAQREYTRPLLLFARPKDPACLAFFRLLDKERTPEDDKAVDPAKPYLPLPSEVRWEFELAAFDADKAEDRAFAKELGVDAGKDQPPAIVALSDDGSAMGTFALKRDKTGNLDSRALSLFLVKAKRESRDADKMLADGLRKAKAENKRVFFILSASWCRPCRLLSRFLSAHAAELEPHYVFVKLDISRDGRTDSLRERYNEGTDNGIPWYAILDHDGDVLISSKAAEKPDQAASNIGFPSTTDGIEHFLKMLKQTAPGLSEETLGALRTALAK